MDKVIELIDGMPEEYGCGVKEQMAIDVAVDELFSNIAHYAYNPETGYATVRVDVKNDPLAVEVTFIYNGVPYDPLAKADPDTTLSIEDRKIGGLGIFIVKKSMDAVNYEYKDRKEYPDHQKGSVKQKRCSFRLHRFLFFQYQQKTKAINTDRAR